MSECADRVRKKLLTEHDPSESGTWRILGEDPNADFGGHHHQPELDVVVGQYRDVVEHALSLKNFFQWGGGGSIIKLNPKKIDKDTTRRRATLEHQKTKLLAQIELIDQEIKSL